MNILIVCANGLSSSIFANKIREYVQNNSIENVKVGSCSIERIEKYYGRADVIFIAPHAQYLKDTISDHGAKVFVIDAQEYLREERISELFDAISGRKSESKKKKTVTALSEISGNRYLSSIRSTFMKLIPVSLTGSLASLLQLLVSGAGFDGTAARYFCAGMDAVYQITIGIMGFYFLLFYERRIELCHGYRITLRTIAVLSCFAMLSGTNISNYGINGLWMGILTVIISDRILLKAEKYKISGNVSLLFTVMLFAVISYSFYILTGESSVNAWVSAQIQTVLGRYVGDNIVSFAFMQLLINFLWMIGLHGASIVSPIVTPLYESLALENLSRVRAGMEPVHIISSSFQRCYLSGGAGSLLSFTVLACLFSKSERMKKIGRESIIPVLFSVNETVLFGIPIVLNPLFAIPLLLITPLLAVLTWFVMRIGLVPIPNGTVIPFVCLPFVYGILQGSWKISVWELVCNVIAGVLWYPFFKAQDRILKKNEDENKHI